MTDYYVSTDTGIASDSNNGLSLATPWKTIRYAVNHISAGSTLHLVTHAPGAMFSSEPDMIECTVTGSRAAPIHIVGVNSSGVVDGTIATIDGSTITTPNSDGFNLQNVSYYIFRNIRILGNGLYPSNGVEIPFGISKALIFINVAVEGCNASGFNLSNSINTTLINCLEPISKLRYL